MRADQVDDDPWSFGGSMAKMMRVMMETCALSVNVADREKDWLSLFCRVGLRPGREIGRDCCQLSSEFIAKMTIRSGLSSLI